ncbi:MAG: OmpA family protein [Nevskiales bacterium]
MRMVQILGAVILVALAGPALAIGKFYVAPSVSQNYFSDDLDDEVGRRIAIGAALTEKWGLELAYDFSEPTVPTPTNRFNKLELEHIGIDALYFFAPGERGKFFALIGAGTADYEVDDGEYAEIGVGYLRPFTRSGFAFRFDARHRRTEGGDSEFNSTILNVGIHIPLGSHEEPEAPPPPPPPPPPAPEPLPPPAVELEPQAPIVLRGVQFDFDSAQLRPESTGVLDEAAKVLVEQLGANVLIMGHTCNIGTDEYNLGLSKRRAKSVLDYLGEHGVATERMSSQGFGESKPIADNSTKPGREENRRVELQLRDEGSCYPPAPGDAQDDKGCAILK